MKCHACGKAEYKWVRGKPNYVFCPECGLMMPNGDGKIKVVGRPFKAEASESQATKPTGDGGAVRE